MTSFFTSPLAFALPPLTIGPLAEIDEKLAFLAAEEPSISIFSASAIELLPIAALELDVVVVNLIFFLGLLSSSIIW